MTLAAGTSLGPYKILAPLGAGGMGEIYRAHDSRLGRDVAIKVLSPHLAATPEVRARFEREARTISQLNHPHICTLFDVGREDGTDYLVMELVEGETLAHRLDKGPLPAAEVLTLGAQIADALDRAHGAGIVHRDLKPGNVMLTKSGAKLMDFGLARAHGLTPVAGALTESPTVSRPLTAEGTIVGTFQYMAPEQLEGKEADARSDLWALGCVLYEMATGKRAFEGASQASLIAAIMDREPPAITVLKPMSPPALEHLVKRCLAKDPGERWQSARDVVHELRWIAEAGSQAGVPAPVAARRQHRERLAWVITVAAVAVAIVAVVTLRWTRRPPAPALARFAVTAPPGRTVVTDGTSAVISPDGRRLAFIVVDSTGTPRLWVRPLDSFSVQPLPGTENAFLPFWSPDSRFIAFFAEGKLRKVPPGGGPPEVICDAPDGRGGSWSKDGVIVFAPLAMGPLLRVSADGGEVTEVARPDSARRETGFRFPCFLPDGGHFLYVSLPRRQTDFDVYLGALDSKEPRRVMGAGGAPIYAEPGCLLFARSGRLVAQRFDPHKMQPVGKIVPLGDAPPPSSFEGASLLSASANGVLVHAETSLPNTRLVWLDRAGRPSGTVSVPPGSYAAPSLSPDGRWAAVGKLSSPTGCDLWLVDLQRAVATRLTFDGLVASGTGGLGSMAVWSPDGSRAAFMYNRSGSYDVYQVLASGVGRPEPLVRSSVVFKTPAAWTPDGRYLVFSQNDEATGWDLWLLPLEGDRRPVPYLRTPFDETTAAISPDGHWLAYDSDETGTPEIYVRSFPEPGEKHRVSTLGGTGAQWSGDGRELLIWTSSQYFSGSGPVFSVDVETTPTFKAGTPRVLFTPRQDLAGIAATRDLKRFLAAVPVEGTAPASITVMLNWPAALKR
jgi:Tol biopolymer transport system component